MYPWCHILRLPTCCFSLCLRFLLIPLSPHHPTVLDNETSADLTAFFRQHSPLFLSPLNHMRGFSLYPTTSAWHGLHGLPLDFSVSPIQPPGQLVVVHNSPIKRTSWAHHGKRDFYLGPSLSHYHCHSVLSSPPLPLASPIPWTTSPTPGSHL
jgi:hypothetical protein